MIAGFLVIPKRFFCLIRPPDKDCEPNETVVMKSYSQIDSYGLIF
jgi:hypothetical protein